MKKNRRIERISSHIDIMDLTNVDSFLERRNEADLEFLKAVEDGDSRILKGLLKLGADHQCQDDVGNTGLHIAAEKGHIEVLKELLDVPGVDVNIQGCNDWTPLIAAAMMGQEKSVQMLIKEGADIMSRQDGGDTALHRAAAGGHDTVIKMLLDQGMDINVRNNDGWTALMYAAIWGKKSTVTLLIEAGADIERKNERGDTVLHEVVRSGREDIVKIFLDCGINSNVQGEKKRTAMFIAVMQNQISTLNILLNAGADMTCKDVKGDTILHEAASEGNIEIVKILLERGIDVNVRGEEEKTAVMKAAFNGHQGTLKFLIKAGADIRCKDVFGNTALHDAAAIGRANAVKTLLDNGCHVNTRGHKQKTALMLAAEQGQGGAVKILLDMGARLDLKDNRRKTAFEIIVDKKMLREREGIIDSMMKHLKGNETYDEELEAHKIIQKIKAILPSSEGLRDCIESLRERFKWSKLKYLTVLFLSFFSIILRSATYGLDVYTDFHFSLSLFGQPGRNFTAEIGECRPKFDALLNKTIEACQSSIILRTNLADPSNINYDAGKCLRRLRKVEQLGASCFNREQRFDNSFEWNTAAIITLVHCGALPLLVSLIIWLSQHSFKICNLEAFLRFPHSLPAMIYQFHYTRKLIGNYAKDRKGEYNKWFFEVNKTKWIEKLRKNESLLNLSHMIEATIESSFQFWFQTIYAFPTILLTVNEDKQGQTRIDTNDFVNMRMLSILFSFGTFAFTFYNIRYVKRAFIY